jgi:hypothetical protein
VYREVNHFQSIKPGVKSPVQQMTFKKSQQKAQQEQLELECLNKPKLRNFITFKRFDGTPAKKTKKVPLKV